MRRAVIVILILILGGGAYLGWDWYAKTQKQKLEPSITLYYWTDSKGGKHVSDTPPPENARDIYTEKGYRHIAAPLVVSIIQKAVDLYDKTKQKIGKPGKSKKNLN